jgi:protein-S-isoprenylcysteine O-methyltransferase Ste14
MTPWRDVFVKVAAATFVFGIFHSFVASLAAKRYAASLIGDRQRNGLYRLFYITQAALSLLALFAYARRLPDRTIYKIRGSLAWLMRLGQLAGFLHAVAAAAQVGLLEISGLKSLAAWISRSENVPREPPAQGPSMDSQGRLNTGWPFSWSRHPLNLSPLPIFWLNPHMTVQLAAFNLASTIYLILGSFHEESRLKSIYGDVYEEYQSGPVPFYFPSFRRP